MSVAPLDSRNNSDIGYFPGELLAQCSGVYMLLDSRRRVQAITKRALGRIPQARYDASRTEENLFLSMFLPNGRDPDMRETAVWLCQSVGIRRQSQISQRLAL